jgi:hypothetical protein
VGSVLDRSEIPSVSRFIEFCVVAPVRQLIRKWRSCAILRHFPLSGAWPELRPAETQAHMLRYDIDAKERGRDIAKGTHQ